jgi:hypothetical protein
MSKKPWNSYVFLTEHRWRIDTANIKIWARPVSILPPPYCAGNFKDFRIRRKRDVAKALFRRILQTKRQMPLSTGSAIMPPHNDRLSQPYGIRTDAKFGLTMVSIDPVVGQTSCI